MARQIQKTLVSDLSGGPADETVRFALDGKEYEIDLAAPEAAEMRSGIWPFIAQARKTGAAPPKRPRKPARPDLPGIRQYMRERGHKVNDRGRIPQQIIDEYDLLRKYESQQ